VKNCDEKLEREDLFLIISAGGYNIIMRIISLKTITVLLIFLSIADFNLNNASALTIRLKSGIQYINSKIILEDKVFINKPSKLEVEVSLGNSKGRILIDYDDIYDIILDESIINPSVTGKTGDVKITDLKGINIPNPELSPLDRIITGSKSSCEISFNGTPYIKAGSNTILDCKIDYIKRDIISNEAAEEAVPVETPPPPEAGAESEGDPADNLSEEFVFYLESGELSGIFNKNKEGAVYSTGLLLDSGEALTTIKSPRFYAKKTSGQGSSILTLLAVDGEIRFTVKNLAKTYRILAGQYVVIFDGDKVQNRMDCSQSPEMKAVFDRLSSME